MKSFRSLAAGLPSSQATRLYGKLDTTIVRFVLKKQMPEDWETLADIAQHFVKELNKLMPDDDQVKDPWAQPGKSSASPSASSGIVSNIVTYDAAGNAVGICRATLQNKGFVVGSVVEGPDGTQSTIVCIDGDGTVRLDKNVRVKFNKFMQEYNIAKGVIEYMHEWHLQVPELNPSWIDTVIKAKIQCALDQDGYGNTEHLQIRIKPTKSVIATASFQVGRLLLLPTSTRFASVAKGATAPQGGFKVELIGDVEKDYYILPMFAKSLIAPFWAVKTVDDEAEANMVIHKRKLTVNVGGVAGSKKSVLSMMIPSMINKVPLKANDELTLFKAVEAKGKRFMPIVVDVGQTGKKAKK